MLERLEASVDERQAFVTRQIRRFVKVGHAGNHVHQSSAHGQSSGRYVQQICHHVRYGIRPSLGNVITSVLLPDGSHFLPPTATLPSPSPDAVGWIRHDGTVQRCMRAIMPMVEGVVGPDQFRPGQLVLPKVGEDILLLAIAPQNSQIDVGADAPGTSQTAGEQNRPSAHERIERQTLARNAGKVGHDQTELGIHRRGAEVHPLLEAVPLQVGPPVPLPAQYAAKVRRQRGAGVVLGN
mmetsp:Transcript_19290/g.55522  ORF Transcript_19290/g.55522 Transcript_19290/m.55522 type:complete len:238 (-) Transcript_19290:33-746(-)